MLTENFLVLCFQFAINQSNWFRWNHFISFQSNSSLFHNSNFLNLFLFSIRINDVFIETIQTHILTLICISFQCGVTHCCWADLFLCTLFDSRLNISKWIRYQEKIFKSFRCSLSLLCWFHFQSSFQYSNRSWMTKSSSWHMTYFSRQCERNLIIHLYHFRKKES
jgi:hypothetical protein